MSESISDSRATAFQRWGSLLIAGSLGVGAVVGHFTGASFNEVMRLALFAVVAAFFARRFWRTA